jgi:hypothetical protein
MYEWMILQICRVYALVSGDSKCQVDETVKKNEGWGGVIEISWVVYV